MSDARERAVGEARQHWGRDGERRVDWSRVEQGLFSRIERERRAERQSLAPRNSLGWKVISGGLAAAACLVAVCKMQQAAPLDQERTGGDEEAASILAIDGPGGALVNGQKAALGTVLQLGDVVETRGASVTMGRPGKLTCLLERASSATVTHVRGALVLALGAGAVEAQVVPVPSGEAFAVDVGPSRVAVHGTHLRVARTGETVAVDLNDGVISIGEAPRIGPTLGALVSAPAHAEFAEADAEGTLRVTHDPSSVRVPGLAGAGNAAWTPSKTAPVADVVANPTATAPSAKAESPPPAGGAAGPAAPAASPARVEARSVTAPSAPVPAAADPNAPAVIAAAFHSCMAARLHADDVTIVVSTTLSLELNDDGSVRSARFDPPVAPDVNACVARAIYKTRFNHAGPVAIPVSFKN